MADVLDDATYRNDATATWGALARTATGLEWEGSLAVGESVTLTYSVRVADTVTGNGALTNTVWSLASSNCATGSTDGACRAVTEVLAQAATSPITSVPIPVTG